MANAANLAALLYHGLPELNWAGFYFLKGDVLVLGPFQGRPACTRIALGKGVCGTAAAAGKTVLVENVHQFPGHIACDGASNSEIVVPLLQDGRRLGSARPRQPAPEPVRRRGSRRIGTTGRGVYPADGDGPAVLSVGQAPRA